MGKWVWFKVGYTQKENGSLEKLKPWPTFAVSMAILDPWMGSCTSPKFERVQRPLPYITLPLDRPNVFKKKKCWNVMPNCWNVMPNCWKRRTRRCFQPIIVASITPPHPIKESRFPLVIIQDLPKLILWLFHVWKITNCSKLDSLTLNLWIRLKMSFING